MNNCIQLLRLLRPKQWVKNLFVFLPLFFNGQLMNIHLLLMSFVVFIVYCLAASAVYCFNDIRDVEADKIHPEKSKRPIASGAVSPQAGYTLMMACLLTGSSLLYSIHASANLFLVIGSYFIINIAYCIKLKQIALIDVFIVSIGFVFRIVAGGFVTGIWISEWIVIMTFLLALFLAFAKRRDDLMIYEQTGVLARKNVIKYNTEFLNATLIITSTVTIVAYIMYSISEDVTLRFASNYVYTTTVFVLLGILRYLQLVFVLKAGGSPTKICWEDRFIQLCILGWIGIFVVIVYF
jgi:4-hydroxybenzoate polyprenyltransferase